MRSESVELEFLYLAFLSRRGLKPVGRWEGQFSESHLQWIKKLSLSAVVVRRRLRFGRRRDELVFGRSARWVEFYRKRFEGMPLRRDAKVVRLEGQLFGYPSCCVEHFIHHGYAPNGLSPEVQRWLFHWACPGCRITPGLVTLYEQCFREAREATKTLHAPSPALLSRRWLRAAASLLLAAGPAVGRSQDPHVLPLSDSLDVNRNLLLDRYEESLVQPPPQIPGTELAIAIADSISGLSEQPQRNRPYRTEFLAWGLETCAVCGTTVNMGFVRVVNPALGDSVDVPFIALHALHHGALDFLGTVHHGRVNLLRLLRVLEFPYTTHALPLGAELDADGDGLLDAAEERLGLDPHLVDADANRVVDGPQLAVDWAAEIRALPLHEENPSGHVYRIERLARDSVEVCTVCGQSVNAGYVEIVNELENFRIEVPFIALHALQHGSFVSGGEAAGWTMLLPRRLHCALHADGTFHQEPVDDDSDGDGLADTEESLVGTDPRQRDTDGDGVPDGRQLAWRVAKALDVLPREPRSDGPYLQEFPQRGVEVCEVCGETVNMGFVRVVNPILGDSLDVPYVAWHAMQHGAFTAQGSLHRLRIDPVRLATLLAIVTSGRIEQEEVPQRFGLIEAHPNPFSERTRFRVVLPGVRAGEAEVEIFDILARRVRTLRLRTDGSGTATATWDGRDHDGKPLPNGVYFCRVRNKAGVPMARLVLLR